MNADNAIDTGRSSERRAAKRAGTERAAPSKADNRAGLVEHPGLRTDLERALERGEFVLRYQPIITLADGDLGAVEALVRWQHPERGLLAPGQFIGFAERCGLIVPLGQLVLELACRQAADWRRAGHPVAVSVNLSPRQLDDQGTVDAVSAAIHVSGIDPSSLILEVTETAAICPVRALGALGALKRSGVRLAIDDFGTGYSSLDRLRRLPIDIVKIDKAFIDELSTDARSRVLVRNITRMSHDLDLLVIAEGVEHAEQLIELQRAGCDAAQGFYFARPMPPEQLVLRSGIAARPVPALVG